MGPAGRSQALAASGESVLWSFGGSDDGAYPYAGLINVRDALYGTTLDGGAYGGGAVFKLTPPKRGETEWSESVLWSFGGAGDGDVSYADLINVRGSLYGTTQIGGAHGQGVVFKLTPPARGETQWSESVLWSFGGSGDGRNPSAGLINLRGSLYGTTLNGGANGIGAVFKLTPPKHGETEWSESVLWSFGGSGDGAGPFAGLINLRGSLYGTTHGGGANRSGVVFKLTPPSHGQTQWSENVLWSFGGSGDGAGPFAGLINLRGSLYGTTRNGGANSIGALFKLTPPKRGETEWSESVLWSFGGGGDGKNPSAGLINLRGTLYGTTLNGGANGGGVVFKLTPPSHGQTQWSESVPWSFGGPVGDNPFAGLINVRGALYGTTYAGGAKGTGTVFKVSP